MKLVEARRVIVKSIRMAWLHLLADLAKYIQVLMMMKMVGYLSQRIALEALNLLWRLVQVLSEIIKRLTQVRNRCSSKDSHPKEAALEH